MSLLGYWKAFTDIGTIMLMMSFKKLKQINIHFNGMGIDGGTFDWGYINSLSAAESSRSNNENKSEMIIETDSSDSTQNVNHNLSKITDCDSDLRGEIKLICGLGDLNEYKMLTPIQPEKNYYIGIQEQSTIIIDSISVSETTRFQYKVLGTDKI